MLHFVIFWSKNHYFSFITTYKGFFGHSAEQFLGSGHLDFHVGADTHDVINCMYACKNGIGFTMHVFVNVVITQFATCDTFFTKIFTGARR